MLTYFVVNNISIATERSFELNNRIKPLKSSRTGKIVGVRDTKPDHAVGEDLKDAIRCIIESTIQAPYDFCGEQREWHLPRLQRAMQVLMISYPALTVEVMKIVKDPYGNFIYKD